MKRIVFWQNMLSHHQAGVMKCLAEKPDLDITWAVKEPLSDDRRACGWFVPDVGRVRIVVDPSTEAMRELLHARARESVHVFTGIHREPLAKAAFKACLSTEATMGLLVEPPMPGGIRPLLLPLHGRLHCLTHRNRIGFVLAIGHMAVEWYRRCGYPASCVFPYAYFPLVSPSALAEPHEEVRLLFLGQCIRRKGGDLLLRALGRFRGEGWRLTIMGGGPELARWTALAGTLALAGRVEFKPFTGNAEAMRFLSTQDLLVLPSRHDGWGAVVNEALLCGVPAICSDRCGAADLLDGGPRGEVFAARRVDDLARVLAKRIAEGPPDAAVRQRIRDWCSAISPETAAEYLVEVFACANGGGEAPVAPWLGATPGSPP